METIARRHQLAVLVSALAVVAATPAIFRPGDITYYFRHTLTQGIADSQFPWIGVGSGWLPVSGTFGLG